MLVGMQNAPNSSTSVKILAVASGISLRALLVKTMDLTGKESIGHWS